MKQIIFIFLVLLIHSTVSYGQDNSNVLTGQDGMLLKNFWTHLTAAIDTEDKNGLSELVDFPFYCRPCIDDSTLKYNNHISIKVSRRLFLGSQYKIFFEKPIATFIKMHRAFDPNLFQRGDDAGKRQKGFYFLYTIRAPSATSEGLQGLVDIVLLKGKYKMTGIQTVP